jgi:SAM-dependent methyltransferase
VNNFIRKFPGSAKYWEHRYKHGSTSGEGSCGEQAKYKAKVINEIIKKEDIKSMLDFGCGDGDQLALIKCPNYIGLDVSKTAIYLCKRRFIDDKLKSFYLYDPEHFGGDLTKLKSDLAISLDVIYHLVEEETFYQHLVRLFGSAKRFVIIFSTNIDNVGFLPHIKHRKFTDYVKVEFPGWKLVDVYKNPHKRRFLGKLFPCANFYIYKGEDFVTHRN